MVKSHFITGVEKWLFHEIIYSIMKFNSWMKDPRCKHENLNKLTEIWIMFTKNYESDKYSETQDCRYSCLTFIKIRVTIVAVFV